MKLKTTITGRVHGVGYRVKLINVALEYGIDRFSVFNVHLNGKQAVVCLIDAPDEIVEIIKQRIKTEKPEKAVVESVEFEEYRYEVPPIERCMQAFQMEHWGKAIPILLEMLEKQDKMLEKQDLMLEKQDETIRVIKEESEKTRQYLGDKIDRVAEKIDDVSEGVNNLKTYMQSHFDERLKKIEEEIVEIKTKIRML